MAFFLVRCVMIDMQLYPGKQFMHQIMKRAIYLWPYCLIAVVQIHSHSCEFITRFLISIWKVLLIVKDVN